jgi:periplasmic divalent cation tolerance protein
MPTDVSQNNNNNNIEPFCIILTTTDSAAIANKIAEALVAGDIASCVQIDNINSVFKWHGNITTSTEFRLMIKALSSNYNKIQDLLVSMHNYEIPEIIKLDITGGLPSYLNWLKQHSR